MSSTARCSWSIWCGWIPVACVNSWLTSCLIWVCSTARCKQSTGTYCRICTRCKCALTICSSSQTSSLCSIWWTSWLRDAIHSIWNTFDSCNRWWAWGISSKDGISANFKSASTWCRVPQTYSISSLNTACLYWIGGACTQRYTCRAWSCALSISRKSGTTSISC